MNQFDDVPPMAGLADRDFSGFSTSSGDQMPVPYGGAAMIVQTNRETTARRVAVPRDPGKIFTMINTFAGQFGDQYTYSWEAKDRRSGKKSVIEGGTIKLANMLARAYGNCQVDCDVSETATHIIFKAFFIDFETGLSTARLFQQRKSQNTGMGDVDRQADIIFQVGQSKAIRNVIINALSDFAQHAIEESKKGMLKKFASPEAREIAEAFIDRALERFDVSEHRLDATVGRRRKDWDVRNLAKAYSTMRALVEGMVSVSDAFPTDDAAAEINAEHAADTAKLQSREEYKETKAKAEGEAPKKVTRAKAEPKPAETKPAAQTQADDTPDITRATLTGDKVDIFIDRYKAAKDFETVEAIRADAAKANLSANDTNLIAQAREAARERIKEANKKAAKPKPADDTFPGDLPKGETLAKAPDTTTEIPDEDGVDAPIDPEVDEEDVIGRIESMFDGLDQDEDIEHVRSKTLPLYEALSKGGQSRVTMAYNTAQKRAEAKAKQVDPEPSETTMLFGDD